MLPWYREGGNIKSQEIGKYSTILSFIFPIAFGLSFVIFFYPTKNILYTQDSINSFIYPFSYGNNPLAAAVSHGGNIQIFYEPFYFIMDTLFYVLEHLGLNVATSERIWLIILLILSNIGLFEFYSLIIPDRNSRSNVGTFLAICIYWLNPFTITVTLWHIQAWFLFQAVLPYVFVLIILISNNDWHRPLFFISLLLLVTLAGPGLFSAYAIVVSFIFAIAVPYIILKQLVAKVHKKRIAFNVILLMGIFLAITFFTYYYYFLIYITGLSLSGYIFGSLHSLIPLFINESVTTTLWRVVTLTGFVWLSPNYGLGAYPWYSMLWLINFTSVFLPVVMILSFFYIKKSSVLALLVTISGVMIVFSTGDNFPFSTLNLALLSLGGPFEILVNSYYFSIQTYVFTISFVVFYVISDQYLYKHTHIPKTEPLYYKRSKTLRKSLNHILSKVRKISPKLTVFLSIIIILGATAPVAVHGEYISKGYGLADSIDVPNSFAELHNFFLDTGLPPEYYVLVLPLSTINAVEMKINNASFTDSMNLLQSIIPFPVIDWTQDNSSIILDNLLTHPQNLSLTPLLEAYHIKYVVINPYVNDTPNFMNRAANGLIINMSMIENALNSSRIMKYNVGPFTVFNLTAVMPIADIYTEKDFLYTHNLSEAYCMISDLNNSTNSINNLVINSLPITLKDSGAMSLEKINQFATNIFKVNPADCIYKISREGKIQPMGNNSSAKNNLGILDIAPKEFFNVTNTSNITTTYSFRNGSFNDLSGLNEYLRIDKNIASETLLEGKIFFPSRFSRSQNYWFTINVSNQGTNDNLSALFSLVVYNGSDAIAGGLVVNGVGIVRASETIPTDFFSENSTLLFKLVDNSSSISFSAQNKNVSYTINFPINPIIQPNNGIVLNYSLLKLLNLDNNLFSIYSLNISNINLPLEISDINAVQALNFSFILMVPPEILKTKIIPPSYYGNNKVEFDLIAPDEIFYAVFFSENSHIIRLTSSDHALSYQTLPYNNFTVFKISNLSSNTDIFMELGPYKLIEDSLFISIGMSLFLAALSVISLINRKWRK